MEDVCRLCTKTTDALTNIFDEQTEEEPNLAEMLNECFVFQINEGDRLPKQICQSCVHAAQSAYEFKRKCEESNLYFVQLLDEEEDLDVAGMCEVWSLQECDINEEHEEESEMESVVLEPQMDAKINSSHRSNRKKHLCETCGKLICSADQQRHNLVHSGERPYKCAQCPKSFVQRRNLTDHERRHTNEYPYECSDCPRNFTSRSNWVSHMRVHKDDRRYKCPHCSKGFVQSGSLQTHLRVHTGERPYKCDLCPKVFTTNTSLHNHSRSHSGERPFVCSKCSMTFPRKETLKNHMILHASERPFKCPHCPKEFCIRGSLKRHSRVHSKTQKIKRLD